MRARIGFPAIGLAFIIIAMPGRAQDTPPTQPGAFDASLFVGSAFPGSELLRVNSYDTLLAQLSIENKGASVAYAPFITRSPYSSFPSELRLLLSQAEKITTIGVSWTHNPASPLGANAQQIWTNLWVGSTATYPEHHAALMSQVEALDLAYDQLLARYVPSIPADRVVLTKARFAATQKPDDTVLANALKAASKALADHRSDAEVERTKKVNDLLRLLDQTQIPSERQKLLADIASVTNEFDAVRAALAGARNQLTAVEEGAATSAGEKYVNFREALTKIRSPTLTLATDASFFELLGGSSRDADADGLNDAEHSLRSRSVSVAADWRPADGWQVSALLAALEKRAFAEEGSDLASFGQASVTLGYRLRVLNSAYASTPEFKESLFVPMLVGGLGATYDDCREAAARCPDRIASTLTFTPFLDFKLKKEAQFRIGPQLKRQRIAGKQSTDSIGVVSSLTVAFGAPK